jgi:hypothetical protein
MKAMTILAFCGVLLLATAAGFAQESNCDAFAQATLDTDEQGGVKHLQFTVEVSTSENCAKIEYDLVIDELLPNGQTKKERLPRFVKLDDGSLTEMVRHEIPASFELRSYEAKVVSCVKCEIMP